MAKGKLRPTTTATTTATVVSSDPHGGSGNGSSSSGVSGMGVEDGISIGPSGYKVGGLTGMTTQPQPLTSSSHLLHPAPTTHIHTLHPATPISTASAQGQGLVLPLARALANTQVALTDFSPPVVAQGPGLGPGLGLRHPAGTIHYTTLSVESIHLPRLTYAITYAVLYQFFSPFF